jgi:hypothetical protein
MRSGRRLDLRPAEKKSDRLLGGISMIDDLLPRFTRLETMYFSAGRKSSRRRLVGEILSRMGRKRFGSFVSSMTRSSRVFAAPGMQIVPTPKSRLMPFWTLKRLHLSLTAFDTRFLCLFDDEVFEGGKDAVKVEDVERVECGQAQVHALEELFLFAAPGMQIVPTPKSRLMPFWTLKRLHKTRSSARAKRCNARRLPR